MYIYNMRDMQVRAIYTHTNTQTHTQTHTYTYI